jgi:alpha-tubulin suppressor-like RCC1 family protein
MTQTGIVMAVPGLNVHIALDRARNPAPDPKIDERAGTLARPLPDMKTGSEGLPEMLHAPHRAARRRLGPLAALVLPIVFVLALVLAPSALAGGGKHPSVVSGHDHTCAQDDVGYVHCWGANGRGQLGTGDTADRMAPTQVSGVKGAYALAAYGQGTCAVVDGKVWCWGANDLGQLGQGGQDGDPHPAPVQVPGVEGIWRISGGDSHVCAVDWSGNVYCWGSNSDGQLANGTTGGIGATPAKVGDTKDVYSLAAGAKFTCVGLHSK